MIPDPDIYRAAALMVDQHGKDAALRALERADYLLEQGDMIGSAVWRRVVTAIRELSCGRKEDEAVN